MLAVAPSERQWSQLRQRPKGAKQCGWKRSERQRKKSRCTLTSPQPPPRPPPSPPAAATRRPQRRRPRRTASQAPAANTTWNGIEARHGVGGCRCGRSKTAAAAEERQRQGDHRRPTSSPSPRRVQLVEAVEPHPPDRPRQCEAHFRPPATPDRHLRVPLPSQQPARAKHPKGWHVDLWC